jgi:hypothetical protein
VATSSSQQPSPPAGLKYYQSAVEELLLSSLYLDTFVTSRRGTRNVALPLPGSANPADLTGLQIFGQAQPLSIKTTIVNGAVRGAATLGSTRAGMSLRWVLAPDDEFALPYEQPLPTLFDARSSQRFNMMDAEFRLDEDGKNAFHGFGAGRTYPAVIAGEDQVWLGACGKIMHGTGVFENVQGSFVLNGRITPPDGLACEMLIRVLASASGQPAGGPPGLKGVSAASLGATIPLAGATYLTFLGAPDPNAPLQQHTQPDGTVIGAAVTELLRPVRVEHSLGNDGKSLRAHYVYEDWIAGRLTTQIHFTLNPSDPPPPDNALSPLPWYTEDTTITFFDPKGKEIGAIAANIAEGRGFSTHFAGFPGPILNLVGFGPFAGGTGSFAGAQGMLSVNAGVSVDPATLSNLYVLRLAQARGR